MWKTENRIIRYYYNVDIINVKAMKILKAKTENNENDNNNNGQWQCG
jgi:hypothetical protein